MFFFNLKKKIKGSRFLRMNKSVSLTEGDNKSGIRQNLVFYGTSTLDIRRYIL